VAASSRDGSGSTGTSGPLRVVECGLRRTAGEWTVGSVFPDVTPRTNTGRGCRSGTEESLVFRRTRSFRPFRRTHEGYLT
jgi:hypothetical protein